MPSDFEEAPTVTSLLSETTLSSTSIEKYEKAYERLVEWCSARNFENESDEEVLLSYFSSISGSCKPSSLYNSYSMLRTVISAKRNVDISEYRRLLQFLKENYKGFIPKKSRTLTKHDIRRFLIEADDREYLLMKVALIIGLAGPCRREEFAGLRWENVKDEGRVLHVAIPNRKTKKTREFFITSGNIDGVNMVQIVKKYMRLRPKNTDHGRFFLGYRNGTCIKQPVGINTFGSMPKNIAAFLKLPNPEGYTGHCYKWSSKSLCKETKIEEEEGYIDSFVEIKEERIN